MFALQALFTAVLMLMGVALPVALATAVSLLAANRLVATASGTGLRRVLARLASPADLSDAPAGGGWSQWP